MRSQRIPSANWGTDAICRIRRLGRALARPNIVPLAQEALGLERARPNLRAAKYWRTRQDSNLRGACAAGLRGRPVRPLRKLVHDLSDKWRTRVVTIHEPTG